MSIEQFRKDSLAWLSVHHYLSAPYLRLLLSAMVEQISNAKYSFVDLFEEVNSDSLTEFSTWIITPRNIESPLADYLIRRISSICRRYDTEIHFANELMNGESEFANCVESAIKIGHSGFEYAGEVNIPNSWCEQDGISLLVSVLRSESPFQKIESGGLESVSMPLQAVLLKNLGDRYVEIGEFIIARELFQKSRALFDEFEEAEWSELVNSMQVFIEQSLVGIMYSVDGADEASKKLSSALSKTESRSVLLLKANATRDLSLINSRIETDDLPSYRDLRTVVTPPPQLISSLNIEIALESLIDQKYDDSVRVFWAILRRQISLGSITASQLTKSYFWISLMNRLKENIGSQHLQQQFDFAIHILLEGGDCSSVSKYEWSEEIVNEYLQIASIESIVASGVAFKSYENERKLIIVELFKAWITKLNFDKEEIATLLVKQLACFVREEKVSLYGNKNIAGSSLKALIHVADKRPELRFLSRSVVASAIVAKLSKSDFWTGPADSLELAKLYADVLDDGELIVIINATLSLLEPIKPEQEFWVIVRPAMQFLMSESVTKLISGLPNWELGGKITKTLLHFGLNQKTEQANLLHYLKDFDPSNIMNEENRLSIEGAVNNVISNAANANSSAAVFEICVLLLSPKFSKMNGVVAAIEGIRKILDSTVRERSSISFPTGYQPLLILAQNSQSIINDLNISKSEFIKLMLPLLDGLKSMWNVAAEKPQIFAPFSFLTTQEPNPVIIHNWTYASIQFAEKFGEASKIEEFASIAATKQELLRNSIHTATQVRKLVSQDKITAQLKPSEICAENSTVFYSLLGMRLASLHKLSTEDAVKVCEALLEQCIKYGPKAIDGAVFVSADKFKLSEYAKTLPTSDYRHRLEDDKELRLSVAPLLGLLISE